MGWEKIIYTFFLKDLNNTNISSRVKLNKNETEQSEQNGGVSTSGQDIQRELRKQETEQRKDINDLPEKQGRQYEGRGDRVGNGVAGEPEISKTGIKLAAKFGRQC